VQHPLADEWHRVAVDALPPGTEVWDSHTHTGDSDPDGYASDASDLITALHEAGHTRAVVTPCADPAGYRVQNERVLAEADSSGGTLIPYLRVDPRAPDAAESVAKGLSVGFRGVKIHPRSELFSMDHPGVGEVAAAAAEKGAPILIHAGRGMPPLGPALVALVDATPGLTVILAHAAISDQGTVATEAESRPRILFDTAWWNTADLLALFGSVDASRILYASDNPYWTPAVAATITTRSAVQAGLSGQALRAVLGENLRRVLEDKATPEPLGVGFSGLLDPVLLRVASNLYAAIGSARAGTPGFEAMELAVRATETGDSVHGPLLRAVRRTVQVASEITEHQLLEHIGLLLIACCAALTPAAPVPDI
jgi:predicted TIM-barrel fold metal-dependent hydrolase